MITLDTYDGTTPINKDIIVAAITNEGTLNAVSHTFTENGSFDFAATDLAGNVATKTVTITNIDKTAPTAVTTQTPAANLAGWNNTSVIVDWNWSDNGSGIDTTNCIGNTTAVSEGATNLASTCKDRAGNIGNASYAVKIDKTTPELQFNFDQTKKDLIFTATDNLTPTGNIAITDANGIVAATDQAGNAAALSFTEKDRKQSLRAQVSGLSYNGKAVDTSVLQIAFAWFYSYTPPSGYAFRFAAIAFGADKLV